MRYALLLAPLLVPSLLFAQASARPPALDAIRPADIRRDIDILASDAMRGREAGTIDEIRAAVWMADRFRAIGLEPAGEDGSFFQWWPLRRSRLSESSSVSVDGKPLALWRDLLISANGGGRLILPPDTTIDAPVIFVDGSTSADVKGKAVVVAVTRPANTPPPDGTLSSFVYVLGAFANATQEYAKRGAAAVIVVPDAPAVTLMPFLSSTMGRGSYEVGDIAPTPGPATSATPAMIAHPSLLATLRGANRLTVRLATERFTYPSVNVIARLRGTDPAVRDEYVLFSGHLDHDGVRPDASGDSIMNGADDNASTDVALLAIARAWKRNPGRRSALFVVHGAEEKGLLGSQWHATHPVIPKEKIVAVIDGDLLGRNAPDTAWILGTQPPHRTSAAFVDMALRANATITKFALDTTWDRPDNPQQAFYRSDHLPYVRVGIPGLFFSSGLHADYHTPRDEPKLIDEKKLARMAQWMYATGWSVSQAKERVKMDPGFKLEH